ncbi:MAG: FAD binding domain-containing protein [Chloroflexi bacterium]|nr:FAD binding domain-containing protein [Chloroflexota bacterium]
MTKQPAAYYRPDNLAEALRLLQQPDTVPLAGGTKLLAADITVAVVDLQDLGLNQVQGEAGRRHFGATMTLAEISAVLAEEEEAGPAALLRQAIQQAGPNTYRNAATLGGTIASRLPDSELLAALLVLDVTLSLYATAYTSEPEQISLVDYLAGTERPFGLITAIHIPWQNGRFASERVARTPADYPIVSVTMWQPADAAPCLAATGITPLPVRLTAAEAALVAGDR